MNTPIPDITHDIHGKKIQYHGDSKIRNGGTRIAYSPDHVAEYKKCSGDLLWFIEHYCYIMDADKGLSIPELYRWQKRFLRLLSDPTRRKIVAKIARQSGKSTLIALYIVWYSCFHNDKTSGIVANKEDVAKEIFKKVMITFRHLPHFLKPGVIEINKTSLELDNGSRVVCGATSESGLSGFAINGILLMDEVAKIQKNLYDSFYESMEPTLAASSDSKLVMISTPVGHNQFYTLWNNATDGNVNVTHEDVENIRPGRNGFTPFAVSWDSTPKRDEEWRVKKIQEVGQAMFDQEYCCLFTSSKESLLTSDEINKILVEPPRRVAINGLLRYHMSPEPDRQYIIAVDIAEGLKQDYSVAVVVALPRPGDPPAMEEAAMFRSNEIDPTALAHVLAKIGKEFNDALIVVEANFGTETGKTLQQDLEYENLYVSSRRIGIRMDYNIKRTGISRFTEMLNSGMLKPHSGEIIEELSNFVRKRGSYAAAPGFHDDVVMAWVLFCYFTSVPYFQDYGDVDHFKEMIKRKVQSLEDAEDSKSYLTPIFIDDGSGARQLGGGSYGSIFDR